MNQKILTDRTTVLSWWGKTNTPKSIKMRTMTDFQFKTVENSYIFPNILESIVPNIWTG